MLSIDSIERGIVIDHIKKTRSMEIYNLLNLEGLDCSVAILKNVKSKKIGRKDIIKIENIIDLDFDFLGYIDPNITINIIDNGVIVAKKELSLPKRVKNVAKCNNPRCITTIEPEIDSEFKLTDKDKEIYRCIYCEQKLKRNTDSLFN